MKKVAMGLVVMISSNLMGMRTLERGSSLLHAAARDGAYEIVAQILHEGRYAIDAQDLQWGLTPLMEAIRGGHDTVVALLIHQGAHLEVEDHGGRTALSYAAENAHYENYKAIIALLLLHGADPRHGDNQDNLPRAYDSDDDALLYSDVRAYLDRDDVTNDNVLELDNDFHN